MKISHLLYNSVTVSLPKNIMQYLLGFVLFWLTYGYFDVTIFALSLAGFVLAYSSVYFFNDIADCEEDKKDEEKLKWKLIAGGVISKKAALALGLVFLVSGLLLSSLVGGWYLSMIILILFLNLLHSHPKIKLKKRLVPTTINMTVIEFFKYSTGWFAFTGDLTRFPFWIMMTFALVYSAIYIIYKFSFSGNMIKDNRFYFAVIAIAVLLSYIFSVVLYGFALPLILLVVLSIVLVAFSATIGKRFKFMSWLWLEFIILPAMIMAFLIISIPFAAQANADLNARIGEYKDTVYEKLPDDVVSTLDNLSEPGYDSLEEIEQALNKSINDTFGSMLK